MAIVERELIASKDAAPFPWRCSRQLFYQMGDLGLFDGQRVMLIEGEILRMPPIGPQHQGVTTILGAVLRSKFGDGFVIREQGPFDIGAATDPEPDIAVVIGEPRDFLGAHPTKAMLIVEVSVSTLTYDRAEKAGLYAGVDIQDYWIVNPQEAQVEVFRRPQIMDDKPFGFGYAEVLILKPGDTIEPLAKPGVDIAVADLLP